MVHHYATLKSPITWFGGKQNLAPEFAARLPKHTTYVEPFGGGAALLFAKPASDVEVYNELDEGLVNFFRVLRDDTLFPKLQRWASLTPYSREIFKDYRDSWESEADSSIKAAKWFYVSKASFSGRFGSSWGFSIKQNRAKTWHNAVERLPDHHCRTRKLILEKLDWRDVMEKYDAPDTLFYLDPPYVHGTRTEVRYDNELTDQDHTDLVDVLLNIQGKAMLSGYHNPIYNRLGWKCEEFRVYCHSAGKTRHSGLKGEGGMQSHKRTEVLWKNYRAPEVQLQLF